MEVTKNREGEDQLEDSTQRAPGRAILEAVLSLWFVGLMGYFYYTRGYWDLLQQIWRSFFG
ncbi:MAG: hypothetical protein HOL51_28090 [Gemmatimonadetes bacterium]|jgi:hypothetical protein|nr:hypothetical protein [Gemmatimonadota bacterium]